MKSTKRNSSQTMSGPKFIAPSSTWELVIAAPMR